MDDTIADKLLTSIQARRLVLLAGAGLSMGQPSTVPGATQLARECARKHLLQRPHSGLPLNAERLLGVLAQHFWDQNLLERYMVEDLVDWEPFLFGPNAGHAAVADLLACKALAYGVTTNFDYLIERAAETLGHRDFRTALNGVEAQAISPANSVLLKIHGCGHRGRQQTFWCDGQLQVQYWKDALAASIRWIEGRLEGYDILILGFWTDWAYLNEILSRCVVGRIPQNVFIVDLADEAQLQERAPDLWSWANDNRAQLHLIQDDGSRFLDELRRRLSAEFLARYLALGSPPMTTVPASTVRHEQLTSGEFYDLRRNLLGIPHNRGVDTNTLDASHVPTAEALRSLLAAGGSLDGSVLLLGEERVRLVHAPGKALSTVRSRFEHESLPQAYATTTVCVGAFEDGAPSNIVRQQQPPTVARAGDTSTWTTALPTPPASPHA